MLIQRPPTPTLKGEKGGGEGKRQEQSGRAKWEGPQGGICQEPKGGVAGGNRQDREKPGGRLGQIVQSSARCVQCLGPFPSALASRWRP